MTIGELMDSEDCELCPFMRESICPGGWKSDGCGNPVEPPCTGWGDDDFDTDVEDLLHEYYAAEKAWEDHLEMIEQAARESKEKKERRSRKRKAMESYCIKERSVIKVLKKHISAIKRLIDIARIRASAFNSANEIFGYDERYSVRPDLQVKLDQLNADLEKANAEYKLKRKEFYKNYKEQ